MFQLASTLEKNFIEKRRNKCTTFCEFFSHFLILTLLVYGYRLSTILSYDSQQYDVVQQSIPPSFVDKTVKIGAVNNIFSAVNPTGLISYIGNTLARPIPIPPFDFYVTIARAVSNAVSPAFVNRLDTVSLGRAYGNILEFGALHFAPYPSILVDSYVSYMLNTSTTFKTIPRHYHSSEDSAVNYILNHLEERTFALIVLRKITTTTVNYVIRMNYTVVPKTSVQVSTKKGLVTTYQEYYLSGFLSVQDTLDHWVFKYTGALHSNRSSACSTYPSLWAFPEPTYKYNSNVFYTRVGALLGLALTMSMLYPVSRLVKTVVEEKETRMREVLKIMGLREWVHRLSWFITAALLFLFIAITFTLYTSATFMPNSNPIILFAYFFLFCFSLVNMCFLVSVFLSNAKLAAIVGPVVLVFTILPKFIFFNTETTEVTQAKIAASLLSPVAFCFGADIIVNYESTGVGVQFYNMNDPGYNMNLALGLIALDFVLYGMLAWYLDQVIPQQLGPSKHPLFIFFPSYWSSCLKSIFFCSKHESTNRDRNDVIQAISEVEQPSDNHETLPEGQMIHAEVIIQRLRKVYADGKVALNHLDLTLVEGQITCLLGHNGAGKSTTISLLTGMITATAGECYIYGHTLSSTEGVGEIRKLTGICPQQNVLFASLTVREHLLYFGSIKGLSFAKLRRQADEIIDEVGLSEKRHVLSSALSGGQKRKLCLGMALIGDPKFLLLDEPTSGMDPYARRAIWDVLQKRKVGRVTVFTTHYLDEADVVSDRVAILSEGKLRCSGSALFLKNKFGAGYILLVALLQKDGKPNQADREIQQSRVTDAVHSVSSSATLTSVHAGELVYELPMAAAWSLGDLCAHMTTLSEDLGISSFGVSITSLEQVFISLAREDKQNEILEDSTGGHVEKVGYLRSAYQHILAATNPSAAHELYRAVPSVAPTTDPINRLSSGPSVSEVEMTSTANSPPNFGPHSMKFDKEEKDCDNYDASTFRDFEQKEEQSEVPQERVGHSDKLGLTMQYLDEEVLPDSDLKPKVIDSHKMTMRTKLGIQFWELMKKRYLIASRDIKGFFFQIIFPAIQIVLILALLTVVINPAGPTCRMLASSFKFTPQTLAGGRVGPVYENLSASRQFIQQFHQIENSTAMSNYMLNSYLNPHPNRYASYVFNNSIPVNLTVDFNWLKANAEQILLNNPLLISNFLPISLSKGFHVILKTSQVEQILQLPNITKLLELNQTGVNLALKLISDEEKNYKNSTTAIQASYAVVEYNPITNTIDVMGVFLSVGGVTILSGNISIGIPFLFNFLPSGIEVYNLYIPSPYTIMHNSTGIHGVGIFNGELKSAFFQTCSPGGAKSATKYVVKNHPLPLTAQQTLENQILLAFLTSIFILIPLCYIPAAFVAFVVRERTSKAKHIQIVSSVDARMYWIATYAWDSMMFIILDVLIVGAFFIYVNSAAQLFIGGPASGAAVFLLLLTYGLSIIPLCYLYSMFFENHSTCQITITVINFITGFILVLAYFIMSNLPQTQSTAATLVYVFRLFPCYNIGEGLIAVAFVYYENKVLNGNMSVFDVSNAGRNMIFMAAEAVVFLTAVLLTEAEIFRKVNRHIGFSRLASFARPDRELDTDVQEEADTVAALLARHNAYNQNEVSNEAAASQPQLQVVDYSLLLDKLDKVYAPTTSCGQAKHALNELSLGLKVGERFGFLGVNGAGKSTTLAILTGDIQQTSGTALVAGLAASDPRARLSIGFCPQVDPLLDLLNAYETLWFFGRIRGIPNDVLGPRIDSLIRDVGLLKHACRPCGNYSGGNKRKLSLAIALVGDPALLLLDEPSSGMDPQARRDMWDVIAKVSAQRTVVLTTHSMEECEALCTRIGIMVRGSLQCLGTGQHLKSKFGQGYETQIRCTDGSVEAVLAQFLEAFPLSTPLERHSDFIRLRTPSNSDGQPMDLASAFGLLQRLKAEGVIVDYALSQATLEQIFVHFATEGPDKLSSNAITGNNVAAGGNNVSVANLNAVGDDSIDTSETDTTGSRCPRRTVSWVWSRLTGSETI